MAYIGKQPLVGNYQVLDSLTATTTATYALTKNSVAVYPQTPANCIVSLNGVIQAPFDSYTISGSNIVFASALTASDSIDFITVLGDVLNVGTVSDGTIGLAKLSATGTPSSSTFLRGDNTWQSAGGTNTPAFQAYKSSSQSLSAGSTTKITFDSENFDTNSCYDTSTSRFTPTVAGKYFLDLSLQFDINTTGALLYCYAYLYKNGSNLKMSLNDFQNGNASQHNATATFIVDMNGTTDYIEAYGHIWNTGAVLASNGTAKVSVFSAYKIIE